MRVQQAPYWLRSPPTHPPVLPFPAEWAPSPCPHQAAHPAQGLRHWCDPACKEPPAAQKSLRLLFTSRGVIPPLISAPDCFYKPGPPLLSPCFLPPPILMGFHSLLFRKAEPLVSFLTPLLHPALLPSPQGCRGRQGWGAGGEMTLSGGTKRERTRGNSAHRSPHQALPSLSGSVSDAPLVSALELPRRKRWIKANYQARQATQWKIHLPYILRTPVPSPAPLRVPRALPGVSLEFSQVWPHFPKGILGLKQ